MSLKASFAKVSDKPDAAIGPHGETALHLAAQQGDAALAREILDAGASVYATDQHNNTPVIYAALRGDAQMLELFLRRDAAGIEHAGNAGTALNAAVDSGSTPAVAVFLEYGASIEGRSAGGATPLMTAVSKGDAQMADFLLARGADAAAQRGDGFSPVHIAAQAGDTRLLHLLFAQNGAAALQRQTKARGLTPLECAAEAGKIDAARLLLEMGALPNIVDAGRATALHLAAEQGNAVMIRLLAEEGGADIAKLPPGCDHPPLHAAIYARQIEAARALVRLGADPGDKDDKGRTALHVAAWKGDLPLVKFLAEEAPESDAAAARQSRINALYEAVFYENADVAHYLIQSGGLDLNLPAASGDTVLKAALLQTDADIVEELLAAGADPEKSGKRGRSPLGMAVGRKNLGLAKMLVRHGANVNAPASDGDPALFEAVDNGDGEMAAFLVEAGADLTLRNRDGFTPLEAAQAAGKDAVIPILSRTYPAGASEHYGIQKIPSKNQSFKR